MTGRQTRAGPASPGTGNPSAQLMSFALASWLRFLSISIPLPVLSLFVQDRVAFGVVLVGISIADSI